MKRIIRTLLVVMVFVLVLSSLTGCQGIKDKILGLIRPQPPVTECTHTGGNATCTEKAICSECGEAYGEALGHNYAEGTCTVCGAEDPDYVAPHEHNFVDGKCECGEEDPNYVPPHEHEFVDGKCECGEEDPNYVPPHEHVWSDATCTEPQKCECGETQGEALGHDMVDVEAKAHTCTEDGYSAHKACTRCDKTEGKEVDKAAHSLKYSMTLPTATAPGHTTVVCDVCSDYSVVYGDVNVMTEGTYVLDATDEGLKGTAQGTYTDGQVYVHGGVWEMHMSAKFRVDGSKKTFSDGTYLDTRLNWGGKTQFPENGAIINGTVITTTDETTVKIYWVQGGDDHRQVALYNLAGEVVAQSDNQTAAKGDPCLDTFTVPAGTYVIGNVINQNYHFRIEVVVGKQAAHEHVFEYGECECGEKDPNYVPPVDNGNHSFDASTDVTVGTDKDGIPTGTRFDNGFFKIVGAVTQRVKEGAVYAVEVGKNETGAIEFTLTMKSTVSVVFSSTGGSNTSLVGILDADGNLVANNEGITEVTGSASGKATLTYTLEAGTYRVVSPKETTTDYNRGALVYSITTAPATEEAPHEHVWTDVAGKDATCTEDGYTAHKVCECGEKQGYEVVAAGHKLVDVEGKAATCTEDGYTAYKACSNCDYTEGKTVLPAGHALVDAEGKAATCTEDGYTAYKACSNCDYTEGKEVVEATGHALVDVEGKAATCTEDGYTAYKACSNCDHVEGKEVVEATGHNYENGYCSNDGCNDVDPDHYFAVTIPEALKAEDGWNVEVSGTVSVVSAWNSTYKNMNVTIVDADGNELYVYRLGTEVALGDIITVKGTMATYNGSRQIAQGGTAVITGHDTSYDVVPEYTIPDALVADDGTNVKITGTVVKINGAWSTTYNNMNVTIADENGVTIYVYRLATKVALNDVITVTGAVGSYNGSKQIAEGSTAEIVGTHTCSKWTEATCKDLAACVVCGATTGELLPHTEEAVDEVPATCIATGTTAGVKCSACGTVVSGCETIDKVDHTYVDGVCTTEGCGAEEGVTCVTVSKTVAELITEYGWTSSTTKQSFNLDDNVSVKINGGSNTGKAYDGDHIRIYATDSPAGTITISVPEGYELVSVKISTKTGTYAYLYVDGTTTDICNQTVAVSGQSVLLNSVKNGSNGKQVRVTEIEVTYQTTK